MKGMLSLLEKAGLVRVDPPEHPPEPAAAASPRTAPVDRPRPSQKTPATAATPSRVLSPAFRSALPTDPLGLADIYAKAGVAPSQYPAERLLRLVDGLCAMDEHTRLMAIKAMDAADESWTIEDPLADAQAKQQALALHAELLDLNLQALARDTQQRTQATQARQEKVAGDIRRQMAELEALMAREMAKAAQEVAQQEAQLKNAQERTAAERASLSQLGAQLQGLITRFGPAAAAATPNKENPMASLTPLSKGLIALAVVGGMASAVWHLALKEHFVQPARDATPEAAQPHTTTTPAAQATATPGAKPPPTPVPTTSPLPAPAPMPAPPAGAAPAPRAAPATEAGTTAQADTLKGRTLMQQGEFAQARQYLERAVKNGGGAAACHLGEMTLQGQGGIAANQEAAAQLFQLAQSRDTICFAPGS